jgi:hypothetical protein
MARNSGELLSRVTLLGCPICLDGSNVLTGGAPGGALVLAVVALAVVGGFARFAWRLAKAERGS